MSFSVLVLLLTTFLPVFAVEHSHPISEAPTPLPTPHHQNHHPISVPAPSPHHHHHHHNHTANHHQAHAPTHAPSYSPTHHAPTSHPPAPTHHYPVPTPTHPPAHPVHTPAYPPAHPVPTHPPFLRSFISVQGVVFCKSCKYAGKDTLLGATPIPGATVKLVCRNTKYHPLAVKATTDKNGYFFLNAPKTITSYAFHTCKVYLDSSPLKTCNKASDFHGGLTGAVLRPAKSYVDEKKLPFVLYNVGPLSFEPTCPR